MDTYSLDSKDDKLISKLLRGASTFFNSKFPPCNYNISPVINHEGYSMTYLKVRYNIIFSYRGSILNPKGGGLCFNLKAEIPEKKEGLEKKVNELKISNRRLEESAYLSNQKIEFNCDGIEVHCRLKRIPKEDSQMDGFYSELWGYIIKNIFLSVHS